MACQNLDYAIRFVAFISESLRLIASFHNKSCDFAILPKHLLFNLKSRILTRRLLVSRSFACVANTHARRLDGGRPPQQTSTKVLNVSKKMRSIYTTEIPLLKNKCNIEIPKVHSSYKNIESSEAPYGP
jgi:hypothetical protein